MTQELSGKVAIVTGGANGLGRATVALFVEEGAKVVIADLDQVRGAELAARLGSSARFKCTDVSNPDDVQAVVDFAVAEFGGLHIMFNNAGLSDNSFGRFLDDDLKHFQRVMNVNVLGVILGSQFAARHMANNGGGSIINTSSIAGISAGHGFTSYRASKAAVVHFTKSIAIELGEQLIRVNCICPGNVHTEMATYAGAAPGMTQADVDRVQKAVYAVRMTRQPLKRQSEPIDVAQTALFLGSDRSRQITGQIIAVDGGATAGQAVNQIQQILEARARAEKNS
jgi:NAD(P)-dependent dehydrogenase (short-subunit alcohol dehydrogenase family)